MNKIIRYVFILTIIIVAMLTIIFVMKEKNNKNNKNNEYVKKNIIQKDLRLGVAELDTFNPILSNNRNVYEISKLFYDSLVFIDGTYKPTLLLAEELNKIDDLKYKIKLKKNIKWNGAEGYLTSNDIKFTLERIVDSNSIYKSNIQNIAAITVISDYELELHLKTPDNFLKYKLNFPIMKETNVELFKNTEKYKVPPNIGKYNFLEIKNSTYIFKLNKDYYNFEQKPIIETVTVNIFQNAGEMYNSFKSGNIDILNTLVLDIEKYIGNFGYLKTVYKDREFNYLAFNTQNINDTNLRKAISFMIDKNKILSKMPIEVSDTSYVLDYGSWLYTEEVRLEYNLENAKRILTEAGYKNKNGKWYDKNNKQLMLNILVNNNNENHKIFINQLKEEMELNGFLINIILQNRETYLQNILNKNYDIAIISYTNPIEPNLEMFFGENNFSQYKNEEIINLLNEIKNIDDIQMINKYKKISEIYVKDLPFLPLFRNTKALITSTGLVSELRPNSQNVFQNIEKWYRR